MSSGTFQSVLKTDSNLITIDLSQLFQYLANYLKNAFIDF